MIWNDAKLLLTVTIPGAPVPAGSKRGTAARYKNEQKKWRISTWFDKQGHQHAKISVSDVNASKLKKRAKVVEAAVVEAIAAQNFRMPGKDAPLAVKVIIYRPRGKGHYRSGRYDRILKPDAPAFPATLPDTTKLWRALEDSLTGLLWHDDSRVIRQFCDELLIHRWEEPRIELELYALPETVADLPKDVQADLEAPVDEHQATLLSS